MKLPNTYKYSLLSLLVLLQPNLLALDSFCVEEINVDDLDLNAALVCAEDTLNRDETRAAWYFQVALQHRNQKSLEQASVYFQHALALEQRTVYQLEYAVNHEWQSNLNAAIELYTDILKRDPNNQYALYGMARVKAWQGNLRHAENIYQHLLAGKSDDITALNGLAYVYKLDKNYRKARVLYQSVLNIDPDNSVASSAIRELDALKKHQWEYTVSSTLKRREMQANQHVVTHQLRMRSEFDYRLSAAHSLEYQESQFNTNRLSLNGIEILPDNKLTLSSQWVYKKPDHQYLGELQIRKAFNSQYDLQATLQREQLIDQHTRRYWGIKPRRIDSKTGNLFYLGYYKQIGKPLGLQLQGFYDIAAGTKNSKALALSLYHTKSDRLASSFGYSHAKNQRGNVDTIFLSGNYQLNDRLRLSLNAVRDLDNADQEIKLSLSTNF